MAGKMLRALGPAPHTVPACCRALGAVLGAGSDAHAVAHPDGLRISTNEKRIDSIGAYGGSRTRAPAFDPPCITGAHIGKAPPKTSDEPPQATSAEG